MGMHLEIIICLLHNYLLLKTNVVQGAVQSVRISPLQYLFYIGVIALPKNIILKKLYHYNLKTKHLFILLYLTY